MTDYDTAVLAALPDGYWKLDEASGLVLHDSSPNANDLTGTGAFVENYAIPGPSPAQIPKAMDMINLGTAPVAPNNTAGSYAAGHSFTVEGWWAGVGVMGGNRQCLLEKGFSTAEARPWWALLIDSDGTALFWLRSATPVDYKLTASGPLNDASYPQHGPFHHIVGVFSNAGTAKLYVDGVPAKSMAVPNTGWGTGAQALATGIFNNDRSNGWFAALAVYPTAFTDAGVLDHFNTGIQGNAFYPSQLATQLTDNSALLNSILAAVRKTFPTT